MELREIHRMVETVRHDEEVSLEYMKVCEREKMIREQGEKIGEALGNVRIVRNMRETMSAEQVVTATGLNKMYVKRIFELLEEHPEESEENIASRLISECEPNC